VSKLVAAKDEETWYGAVITNSFIWILTFLATAIAWPSWRMPRPKVSSTLMFRMLY
jgi:hypothetical protein